MTSKRVKINFHTTNGPEGERWIKISGDKITKSRKRISENMKEIIRDFERKQIRSIKDVQNLHIK